MIGAGNSRDAGGVQGGGVPYDLIERVARHLCHESGGVWNYKHTKRAHWRKKAARMIERERGIAVADALMGIFGLRRQA